MSYSLVPLHRRFGRRALAVVGLVCLLGSLSRVGSVQAEPDTAVATPEIQPAAKVTGETVHLKRAKAAKVFMMLPGGEKLLVSSTGRPPAGNLYAINTSDGSIAWTRAIGNFALYAHALSPDGKVFFAQIGLYGHFISTADGTDLGKAEMKVDYSARSQIAAFTPDGQFVDIFYPKKTQRFDAAAFTAGPVVELTPPGAEGRFRGQHHSIAGTSTFLLAESSTGALYTFEGGQTAFKKLMQLPADKARSYAASTGDGALFWVLYQTKIDGVRESRWGVHDAAGQRLREAAVALAESDMQGVAYPLGRSSRAFFNSNHGLNIGAIFDGAGELVPQAYLMGSGDPHLVTSSATGDVVAVMTTEANIYTWKLPAR